MFPPADDPPDLGIPPNRGPLPVRRNPNSKPNPRVCSGHRRNAQPHGIRGVRAHRGSLRGILDGFFYFYCFMFPPADDPPDLGIPPNGGPLPVRTNPRVRPGHQRNARPQGILGARAHRGALCSASGNGSRSPFKFESPISLKAGQNEIALLSMTVGLQNAGPFYEWVGAGLTSVKIKGLNNGIMDLSTYPWTYKVGTWMRGSMDGETYACLLNILAPEHYSPATLDAKDPIHRAKLVFDHTERMDCKRYLSPKDIVEGSPNLSLAFDCSNIPSKEWFHQRRKRTTLSGTGTHKEAQCLFQESSLSRKRQQATGYGKLLLLLCFPHGSIDSSMSGLAVSYGLNLNAKLSRWILSFCKLDNKIISIERIHQYCQFLASEWLSQVFGL
ncbi:hypothetical protein AAG906_029334 [Vitis piasezkii]